MNSKQLLELVNEIERTLPVASWEVDGVQLWPLIRTRMAFTAFDERVGKGWERGGRLRRAGRRLAAALRSLMPVARDICSGERLRPGADAVIVTDGVSTVKIGGLAHDVIGDPMRELLAEAGRTSATWYVTHACPHPRRTTGRLVQWRLDLAQLLGLPGRLRAARHARLARYDEFVAKVAAAGLPAESVALERMLPLAVRVAAMAEPIGRWLRVAAPRIVLVNCYYSLECAAVVLACRRLGIRSVDVQHGVQHLHIAYGPWDRVPPDGYDLLPDYFWCWSAADARSIEAWRGGQSARHAAIDGGNPWVDLWRDDRIEFVAAADKALARALPPGDGCTVLVTLQWGMTDETFLDPLLALMQQSDPAWTWILRLHPVMRSGRTALQQRLDERGLARAWIDDSTRFALPTALRRADVHLTYSSSATLEAASLGVPSAVADPHAVGHFPALVEAGMVSAVDCAAAAAALQTLGRLAATRSQPGAAAPPQGAATLGRILCDL